MNDWFILNAKYRILVPGQVIAPYDQRMETLTVDQLRRWSHRVDELRLGLRLRLVH